MTILIHDPFVERRLLDERRIAGADRFDECWEGTIVMTPMPNSEHQEIVGRLTSIIDAVVGWSGEATVVPGVNLSDQGDAWRNDYRVPDVAVLRASRRSHIQATHWSSADFLIEVTSPGDKTLAKLPFYERLGVTELLIVDREPWRLSMYRGVDERLKLVGASTIDVTDSPSDSESFASRVLPLSFRLVAGEERTVIEVQGNAGDGRTWRV